MGPDYYALYEPANNTVDLDFINKANSWLASKLTPICADTAAISAPA